MHEHEKKPKGHYMGVGMGIGIGIGMPLGMLIGILMDNIAVGISIGAALGVGLGSGIGSAMEAKHKDEMRELNAGEQKNKKRAVLVGILLLLVGVALFTYLLLKF